MIETPEGKTLLDTTPVIITCRDCKVQRATKPTKAGAPRTPLGWKHLGEDYVCGDCWRKAYILRAVSIPVASPLSCTWEELRAALKTMWTQTTAASNRIMTECYTRDTKRKPGDDAKKPPPMPRIYLYPELRQEFPDLPPVTVASLEQAVQRKYRAARYKVVWTGAASLPTHRYPVPFPVSAQSWSGRIEEDRPVVSLPVGEKRIELRLKSGHQFRRQYEQFRLIARGEAVRGEAAIYPKGDALLVKLVAWLPRPAAAAVQTQTLRVVTAPDVLLRAVNAKDEELWVYNGDQLRRWAAEHRKRLQRLAEDAKYEARPVPKFADRRRETAIKFRDRMNSATHEIASYLVRYAVRRKFGAIEYDDSERSFCDLPWHRLKSLIQEKCDEFHLGFIASAPAEAEEAEALADQ